MIHSDEDLETKKISEAQVGCRCSEGGRHSEQNY